MEVMGPRLSNISHGDSLPNVAKPNLLEMVHLENIETTAARSEAPRPLNARSPNPQDWPKWKREVQIWMIAIHSMVATFMAAGIIPAYEVMALDYGVSTHSATYLTSYQILLLGVAPLLWGSISTRFGHYHLCLFSVLSSAVLNIAGAQCTTFGSQMATRVLTAFVISPPMGIGGGIVTHLAEPEKRAEKLGYWTLLTVLGTPAGPLVMGFVTQHLGIAWIYWIFAIINLVQFLAYVILGAETRYIGTHIDTTPRPASQILACWRRWVPRRVDTTPLTLQQIFAPLALIRYPRIFIAAMAHAIIFCYANVAIVVEMPIAFGEKVHFSAQQIGLQFIAVMIGAGLGEQLSGPLSDYFLNTLRKRREQVYPADRLWLVYIGFGTVFAGLLTWGFQIQKMTSWNVTPCIGAAIASFGNQIQTTILLSFAIDSHPGLSTSIGIFTNFCRLVYAFTGPFYFPQMFDALGLGAAYGVMCVIVASCGLIPVIATHIICSRYSRMEHQV